MRQIKFRVWDEEKMVPLQDAYNQDFVSINTFTMRSEFDDIYLMQYTGLKDKNGKEIYEGDILAKGEPERYCGIVKFNNGSYVADMYRYKELETENHSIAGLMTYSYEIIGNIYENKELINMKNISTSANEGGSSDSSNENPMTEGAIKTTK